MQFLLVFLNIKDFNNRKLLIEKIIKYCATHGKLGRTIIVFNSTFGFRFH